MRFTDADYDVSRECILSTFPFRHLLFGEDSLLSGEDVNRLLRTFPAEALGPISTRTTGGDKSYQVANMPAFDRGVWKLRLDDLDSHWQQLLKYLSGPSYARALGHALGLASGPLAVEIRLTSYTTGGWMSRHTDRPEKAFSHNIYLCPGWRSDWGGTLALYESADSAEATTVFVPGAGTSLAFARSATSWHEVLPVTGTAPMPRRAILVHGYHVPARPPGSVLREDF